MGTTEEVWQEFHEAVKRTGMTDNLRKAMERIPVLLTMKPETFEAYCATRMHEV